MKKFLLVSVILCMCLGITSFALGGTSITQIETQKPGASVYFGGFSQGAANIKVYAPNKTEPFFTKTENPLPDGTYSTTVKLPDGIKGTFKIVLTNDFDSVQANFDVAEPLNTPKELPSQPTPYKGAIKIKIDGEYKVFDTSPIIVNDKVMVPLRGIFELFGASVIWNANTKTVMAKKDKTLIIVQIDNLTAYINKQTKTLENPPIIVGNRTMVPISFIAESLLVNAIWEAETKTVIITK